jgi:carbamoyltransferase
VTAVLGISAFYHDSAAALLIDGELVAAVQEERFSRKKHDARFPIESVSYCLREGGLRLDQLDYIAFYEKPLTKFERLLETYFAFAPRGLQSFSRSMPMWLKDKLFMRRTIGESLAGSSAIPLVFLDHHESHAASAFFPSPFDEAAILTLDGVGEWTTTTRGTGRGNRIELTHQLQFPHSLGLLYSAFTYYTGFTVNSGEYKLMGLAPYGRPSYAQSIRDQLIDIKADGSFWMNMAFFNYCQGLTMTNEHFHELFGGPPRKPDTALEQRHMDIAASVQAVTEDIMLRLGRDLHRQTSMKNLVLAGGVALNCVANGRLLREGPFEQVWIQPAAGDAGGALGAAFFVWHQLLEKPRGASVCDTQKGSFLGPQFSTGEIVSILDRLGATYVRYAQEDALLDDVAQELADEKVVGWFHGRMEFGPRALGARSILGDPRSPRMQAIMNLKIKFRESFRPFAPCVLREHVHEWFDMRADEDSPYMLLVAPVLPSRRLMLSVEEQDTLHTDPDLVRRVNLARSTVPAITHVDYSARVQTVDDRHGRFHRLMHRFQQRTGCPVLVNTSFNMSWEPIVSTPKEAYRAFMQSEMDILVLEDVVLRKRDQPLGLTTWAVDGSTTAPAESPWADPITGDALIVTEHGARNPHTQRCYQVEDGIPRFFVPNEGPDDPRDATDIVKQFYETTPFPNYDDLDNSRALLEKARAGLFARLLNEQIPYGNAVLEVGCGTGQLTNFLSIAHRTVLGVDLCLNSLRLAQRFKTENGLERATFAQMNLFRPALKTAFFDVVISNGVLHHTGDCRAAFQRVSRLVKPGGYLVVGLYSAFSRQLHYARRAIFRWTGVTSRLLDPQFRRMRAAKSEAWFRDQYCHPHETSHTLDEVMGWMDESGLTFVNSIPKPLLMPSLVESENLFEARGRGTALSRFLSQLRDLPSGYHEGGFFMVIAQRK